MAHAGPLELSRLFQIEFASTAIKLFKPEYQLLTCSVAAGGAAMDVEEDTQTVP